MKYLLLLSLLACASKKEVPVVKDKVADEEETIDRPKERVRVKITKFKRRGKFRLEGSDRSCFIRWNYYRGVIDLENYQCMLPLEDAQHIIGELLDRVIKEVRTPLLIKKFKGNMRSLIDIEQRIALYVYEQNDVWDPLEGKMRNKEESIENFIINYANSSNAFPELKSEFASRCYKLEMSKLSDMYALRASSLPYYPWLRLQKVKRRAKIPANYDFEFSVSPLHDKCYADRSKY